MNPLVHLKSLCLPILNGPFRLVLLLLALLFGLNCRVYADVIPIEPAPISYNSTKEVAVGQQPNEIVNVNISVRSSTRLGATVRFAFYNKQGGLVHDFYYAPYGDATFNLGPFCPVAQESGNIEKVVISTLNWDYYLVGDSVVKTPDDDPLNATGALNPGEASEVGQPSTLVGSLVDTPDNDPEEYQYYSLYLDANQRMVFNGWAQSATEAYGAEIEVEMQRVDTGTSTFVGGAAPYGKATFKGGFTNQGDPAQFYLRVRCRVNRICKYKLRLCPKNRACRPNYICPCGEDDSGHSDAGPADAFPVELGRGYERSEFQPDLEVYNPTGPSVTWQRNWREASAIGLYASSGFSPGWTHNYDYALNSSGGYDLQLLYPNGAIEELTRKKDGLGNWTNDLNVPAGAPFIARGLPGIDSQVDPSSTHDWQWVELVWKDGSVMRFEAKDEFMLRLVKITNPTGQSLKFSYDGPGESDGDPLLSLAQFFMDAQNENFAVFALMLRDIFHSVNPAKEFRLTDIRNDAGKKLLSLEYRSEDGRLVSVTDAYKRKVTYNWGTPTGFNYPCLTAVSQLKTTNQSGNPTLDQYGYVAFGKRSLLKTVTRAHPNGGGSPVTAENFYDGNGRVTSTRDANGNTRSYTYNAYPRSTATQVTVRNASNTVVGQWTHYLDASNRNAGQSNVSGDRSYVYYDDTANPGRPTRIIDPLNRQTTIAYDGFGNVTQTTSPRGVVTTNTYNYTNWPFGRLVSTQTTTSGITLPATTFTYHEPSGLLASVTGAHPNGGGNISAYYNYDAYGNIISASEPGTGTTLATTTNRITYYSYTLDGVTDFAMKVGRPVAVSDPLGHVTHFRYDERGNLVTLTDAAGNATSYSYDLNGSPLRVELPATNQTGTSRGEIRYAYAYLGGPLLRTQTYDENRHLYRTVTTRYGAEGEVLGVQGDTKSETAVYDALYRLVAYKDGLNHQTNYEYDTDGHLTEVHYPLANSTTGADITKFTSFDDAGAPLQKVDGRGVVTNFTYNDAEGLLTNVSFPASTSENVTMAYDALGRPTSRLDAAGTQTYAYNSVGLPNSNTTTYKKSDGNNLPGWTQGGSYNADGSIATFTTPLGTTGYGYDGGARLTSLTDWANATTTWSYSNNDWLTGSTSPLGVQTNYAYNALGQLTALQHIGSANVGNNGGTANETLAQWGDPANVATRLLYNAGGQQIRESVATTARYGLGGTTNFGYDFKSQLTKQTTDRGLGLNHSFAFDKAGNPTQWRGRTRTFNADNQETTVGNNGLSFAYDGAGNATRWQHYKLTSTPNTTGPNTVAEVEQPYAFTYNAQGQMRQVNEVNSDGSVGDLKQKNGFRGDGLRAWKENASGARSYYFYSGTDLIGSVGEDAQGVIGQPVQLMWGADGLLGQRWRDQNDDEKATYYLWAANGDLALSYNQSGALSSASAYTAWGSSLPNSDGQISQAAFGYRGKYGYYRDNETGLILCTWRFYDPSNGTWTQRDPIGYDGGQNLYGYVNADSVNSVDPLGLADRPKNMGPGKIAIVMTAFIPTYLANAPGTNGILGGGTALGDNRGFSPNGGAYRAMHTVVINLKTGGTAAWHNMGESHKINWWDGGFVSQTQWDWSSMKTSVKGNCKTGWDIHIEGNPRYPFGAIQMFTPGVTYRVNAHITPKGQVTITGNHDAYPAYEIYVYYGKNGVAPLHLAMPSGTQTVYGLANPFRWF